MSHLPTLRGASRPVDPAVAVVSGVAAVAVGVVAARQPVALAAVAVVGLLAWGLWTPDRLNYTLFAVLLLVPVTADPGYPVDPVWIVLLAATAIAALGRIQRFQPYAPLPSVGMLGFAVPAVYVLTGLMWWTGPKDIVIAVAPLACYALVGWHVVAEARAGAPVVRLARAFAWVAVPVTLLAVYQRMSGTWPILDQLAISNAFTAQAGAGRSAGTMGHPIVYGTYGMLAICVAVGLRGRLWQVPFAAGAVGLLLSGSRSAWIGTACALGIWYLAQPRKFTRRGVGLVAAFAAAGTVLVAVGPKPVRDLTDLVRARLTNVSGSSSATARYRRTEEAWSGITDGAGSALFGLGPEAHVRFFQQIGISDGQAQAFDNSYLTLWYDFGVLALLVFVSILAVVLVKLRSLTARMLIVGFAVQIWFFDFYLWPGAAGVLLLAVGIGAAESLRPVDCRLPDPALTALRR
ncbi:O-antigen ligase family protein [Micromonospora sp. LOL_014]|uniref:O-antigen ligase family protein n=1 Tax=Micromonospora sp. LOL_014 TaxID=3345415 RepID=UPI003A879548